jgi:hypothetical protein
MALDTTTAVVATGIVVFAGQWAKKDEGPSIKLVVGGTVLAVMLSVMSQADEKLASQFASLVLVAALLKYAIPIAKKLGYTK